MAKYRYEEKQLSICSSKNGPWKLGTARRHQLAAVWRPSVDIWGASSGRVCATYSHVVPQVDLVFHRPASMSCPLSLSSPFVAGNAKLSRNWRVVPRASMRAFGETMRRHC